MIYNVVVRGIYILTSTSVDCDAGYLGYTPHWENRLFYLMSYSAVPTHFPVTLDPIVTLVTLL